MTAPAIDFSALTPEPLPEGVPNFRASSGEAGNSSSPDSPKGERTGRKLFGRPSGRSAPTKRESVPKLPVSAKKQIEKLYMLVGGFIRPFDTVLGDTIMEQAPVCAESVFELAQTNEQFRAILAGFMTSSLSMAVLLAHLPIILAITAKSSNPKVKGASIAGFMGLKMADKIEVPDLWDERPDGVE